MSDMSSMNRENKKRQLRQRVISSGTQMGTVPAFRDKNEDNSKAVIYSSKKKTRRRKGIMIFIVLCLLAAFGFGVYGYYKYYRSTEYSTVWEIPMNEGSFVGYAYFGNNVLKYTKDGVSCIDTQGKILWVQSYEMKSPIISVNGTYAVIADQQGNSLYVCDGSGCRGIATTLLPIVKVSISQTGVTAAILEDSKASYIQYYKEDGSTMDLTVKSVLSGNGYPLDLSISPDGTQLICSYAYLKNSELKNRVVFYDFSEIGKNVDRLVGGFDEPFEHSLVPRVVYLSEIYSCAFADDSITFFSSKNLASPTLIKQEKIEETVESVFYSDSYVGVIVKTSSGEFPNRMDLYKITGEKVFSKEFDFPYRHVDIDGEHVFLYNDDAWRVYNMSGVEKMAADLDVPVNKIMEGRFPNTFILIGSQMMKEVKLQ